MLGLGVFDRDELWEETDRHRGRRGVRQLRLHRPDRVISAARQIARPKCASFHRQ